MRTRIKRLFASPADNHRNAFVKGSFSQCGEDMIVEYLFRLRGVTSPSYMDIGANHPFYLSNTARCYERGCRGVNIEANPELIKLFERYRPEDTNLNIGISDREGEMDFYIMTDNTLSTFSKEECDSMVKGGKTLAGVSKIKLTTISRILAEKCGNQFPDFLSLDVEGMDFDILRSIDFDRSSPKVICVEAAEYSPTGAGARRSQLIDFLSAKGYYEYANTNLNAIMVKREFWFI